MAASFNKVILAGNLARDPEVRYTPKGTAIAAFSIGVNRRWTGEDRQAHEETTWVDVTAFGAQAETIAAHCAKGSGLLVEGRLRTESWEDKKTGQKRSKLSVILEGFTFTGPPKKDAEGAAKDRPPTTPARKFNDRSPTAPVSSESGPPPEDDDVPF